MKVLEKSKAVELRRRGKTYSEILSLLEVSKGSLNTWLRHIELSDEQISRIKYKNEKIKRKFRPMANQRLKSMNIFGLNWLESP